MASVRTAVGKRADLLCIWASVGKPWERPEVPGQHGGGRESLQECAVLPQQHGRHAVQPVSMCGPPNLIIVHCELSDSLCGVPHGPVYGPLLFLNPAFKALTQTAQS